MSAAYIVSVGRLDFRWFCSIVGGMPDPQLRGSKTSDSIVSFLMSVYVPSLILSFCRGLLVPVLPLYVRNFGITYGMVGFVLAGEGIGMIVGDIPAGMLLRKMGGKWAMILGVVGVAVSTLGLFWVRSVVLVFLLMFSAGVFGALWNISRHALLVDRAAPSRRGRAIAGFGGTVRIGSFLGPFVGGTVAGWYGLRFPFLLHAILAAVSVFILMRTISNDALNRSPKNGESVLHTGILTVLKNHYRVFVTAGAAQLFGQTIRVGRTVIIPLYAAEVLGLDVQAVGIILSVSSFVDMLMFYPAGLLMDRLGRKYAIVPCFLIQSIGMALIPLTGGFAALMSVAVLIGFGNGLGSGTMMTLGGDLAPPAYVGEFLSVWRLIGDGGQMACPLIVGVAAQMIGLSAAALSLSGVGLLSVAIFAFGIPETLKNGRRRLC